MQFCVTNFRWRLGTYSSLRDPLYLTKNQFSRLFTACVSKRKNCGTSSTSFGLWLWYEFQYRPRKTLILHGRMAVTLLRGSENESLYLVLFFHAQCNLKQLLTLFV